MKQRRLESEGYQEVWEFTQPGTPFHAFIAIHSLKRGPALGGVRLWKYPSPEAGLEDVLRLARAMTFKSAVADLPLGGGKGVILEPEGAYSRQELLTLFGQAIESLAGRYVTAKDVGTHAEDMFLMRKETQWVTGLPPERGGAGDPSPLTAYGVFIGMKAGLAALNWRKDWAQTRVSVQGLGSVGQALVQHLKQAGAQIWGADPNPKKLFNLGNQWGLHPLLPEQIYEQNVDIFSPCALGQTLNSRTIQKLNAKLIAGAANDQLCNESMDAQLIQERGILYAPDFAINSGGLIHVYFDLIGYNEKKARHKVEQIGPTLEEIFARSKKEGITTHQAALAVAQARL